MRVRLLAALIALSFAACGSPDRARDASERRGPEDPSSGNASGMYRATGTVLEEGGATPVLCLGGVNESLPPQCSGIPIKGWDWNAVDDEESAAATTWGSYVLTGSYDGETVILATVRPASEESAAHEDPIESACSTPPGGWSVSDPDRTSEPALQSAIASARAEPDHAGAWIAYIEEPTEERVEPQNIILNLAFTGEIEAHKADIRQIWGGPLCVVAFEHTLKELRRIQDEIGEIAGAEFDLELLSTSMNEYRNVVEIGVVVIDPATRERIDTRYGEGVVEVTPQLQPLP